MTDTDTDTQTSSMAETITLPDSRHGDLTGRLSITHCLDACTGTLTFQAETATAELVEAGVLYLEGKDKWNYSSMMAGRLAEQRLDLDDEAKEAVCQAAYNLLAEHLEEFCYSAETSTALVITAEGACLAEVIATDLTAPPQDTEAEVWLVCEYPAYQQESIRAAGGSGLKCWLVAEWLDVPEVAPSDAVPTLWPVVITSPSPPSQTE